MPATTAPTSKAIGLQIVAFLDALRNPDTTRVYLYTQLEQITDVVTRVTDGGVIAEVYGNLDNSERKGFGGRIWDTQSWFILSLCSMESPTLAAQIYDARDALVQPFQVHATLNTTPTNLFQAQFKPNTGRFLRVPRNGQYVRAHMVELETKSEWTVPIPPGVIS